jgi:hypothetical protein
LRPAGPNQRLSALEARDLVGKRVEKIYGQVFKIDGTDVFLRFARRTGDIKK